MPHDKNGQLLAVGDEVILRCRLTAVHEGETQCNVTAQAAERPEGEEYIPSLTGNSRFYEKPAPPAASTVKIKPLLYITDVGAFQRQLQVSGLGVTEYGFNWEPQFKWSRLGAVNLGAHVRRYESMDAFEAEQFNLVGRNKRWPMFFGFELELDDDAKAAEARHQAVLEENARLKDRQRFLEVALIAHEGQQADPRPDPVPEPAAQVSSPEPANFPAAPVAPIAPVALDVPPPPAADQPPRRRRG